MSEKRESIGRTLTVALVVCLVCSVLVAGAAVALRPAQIENRQLDKQRSILAIAGLGHADMDADEVRALYQSRIVARLVDLQTGRFSDAHDPETFDPLRASKDPALSDDVPGDRDIASIKRRERFSTVYLVEEAGQLQALVLPVRGYGLWSTMHGFMALKSDLNSVVGFGFYQHSETPGLGGEIDNPKWVNQWPGKQVFDAGGKVVVRVLKGYVDDQSPEALHQVDGLAGATLTANGVNYLLNYWLGEDGFGPFIAHLRAGEA